MKHTPQVSGSYSENVPTPTAYNPDHWNYQLHLLHTCDGCGETWDQMIQDGATVVTLPFVPPGTCERGGDSAATDRSTD